MKLEIDRTLEQALDFQPQTLADVSDIEMTRLEMTILTPMKLLGLSQFFSAEKANA
jgi:hypothetical protein